MATKKVIPIQWGGYYVSHETDGYHLFRLLDFNQQTYHVQIFKERFDEVPTFETIEKLRPYIFHAPIAAGNLLELNKLSLIGVKPLSSTDLEGYRLYFEETDLSVAEVDALLNEVIEYSTQSPLQVSLEKQGDTLVVETVED